MKPGLSHETGLLTARERSGSGHFGTPPLALKSICTIPLHALLQLWAFSTRSNSLTPLALLWCEASRPCLVMWVSAGHGHPGHKINRDTVRYISEMVQLILFTFYTDACPILRSSRSQSSQATASAIWLKVGMVWQMDSGKSTSAPRSAATRSRSTPAPPFCHACSPLCSGHFRLATCRLPLRSHALGPLHLTDDFDYFKQLLKAHLFGGGLRLQRLRPVTNIPICKLTFLYFT